MPLKIRLAVAAERKALEELQWRASLKNSGDREALLANRDAIEIPAGQIEAGGVFVAELDGAVAGFAAVLPREDGDAELDALFVEPDLWQRGTGRALIAHCCAAVRGGGAKSLHVVGNPHAEGFYLSCGFVNLGTQATRFGVGLLMKREA
jgi:N-acetylglutamate synthase-like GNAT family acetyltransferase